MIGLELADNRDVGGFCEIPELKTGQLVDDDGTLGQLVKSIDGWFADIPDEVGIFALGIQERFDERAGSAFAFSGGDTNNGAGAVVEKVPGDAGLVFMVQGWDAGASENVIKG